MAAHSQEVMLLNPQNPKTLNVKVSIGGMVPGGDALADALVHGQPRWCMGIRTGAWAATIKRLTSPFSAEMYSSVDRRCSHAC